MHLPIVSRRLSLVAAIGLISLVSVGFFVVSAINNRTLADWYLVWNLFLAWLPLVFAVLLLKSLPKYPWLSWRPLLATLLWLTFLPNSFYLISDLVHLPEVASANILYDSVMFESFILAGLMLGYFSIYIIHSQLLARIKPMVASWLIGAVLFLCSFAIYLGRDLRLSSWDILLSPAALLFDVSEPFVDPRHHIQALTTTLCFFVLLGSMYVAVRFIARIFLIDDKTS